MSLKDIELDGDWWQEYEKQIPFVVYGNEMPSETIDTIGGHTDIVPTVAYLLDIDTNKINNGKKFVKYKKKCYYN